MAVRVSGLRANRPPFTSRKGRAIAQAVSSTAAVRGSRPVLVMWNFVVDKVALGAGFLRVLRFPLPIYIPPIAPKIIIYHLELYNRPEVAAVPNGLSPTPPIIKIKNNTTRKVSGTHFCKAGYRFGAAAARICSCAANSFVCLPCSCPASKRGSRVWLLTQDRLN
jgi:hypothetical protein